MQIRGLLLAGLLASSTAGAAEYTVERDHSSVEFEVAHLKFSKVRGRFDDFSGTVRLDGRDEKLLELRGTVRASSIDTDHDKRDKHLRSADFFDVARFPELTAKVVSIEVPRGRTKRVQLELTLHGVTKQVPAEVTFLGLVKDPWGTEKVAVRAVAELNRKDFGLGWNQALEAGGVLVGETVRIEINVQANKNG